nr:glycosyltransferase [uncultured Anaerobutyricum sp.]
MVKVSIVVPVYNVEKYLRKCLNSLVNQTLEEIEIIVVNDGATDNSQQIIMEFEKNFSGKIKSYIKENGGLSDARNYGIPLCKGEYIGFVDSDDYIDESMYEILYEKAKEDDSDMVTCDYYMVYGGNSKQHIKSKEFINKKDMFIAPKAAAWNKIYRRKMLVDNNIVFPKGLIYEDTLFFAKCIPYIDRVSYVPQPLVFYVQRMGSIANTQGIKTQQIYLIFQEIIKFYKDRGLYNEYKDYIEYYCTRITFGSNLERVCRVPDKKMRNKLARDCILKIKGIFPDYKENCILNNSQSIRHMFIKLLSNYNITLVTYILNLIYKRKDRKLFR